VLFIFLAACQAQLNLPFPGQQILFLAKANRAEYTYVAAKWWDGSAPGTATANISRVSPPIPQLMLSRHQAGRILLQP